MERLCTKCWIQGRFQENLEKSKQNKCPHCKENFNQAFQCPSCSLFYTIDDKRGDLCLHCHYIRPSSFSNWYPSQRESCRKQIRDYPLVQSSLSSTMGGVLPHAGWCYSGSLGAKVVGAIKKPVDVFVVLGTVHRAQIQQPCMMLGGQWQSPLGKISVDHQLATGILRHYSSIIIDSQIHESEHSIEIQVPLIQYFFPEASLVPLMVPPVEEALELGKSLAQAVVEDGRSVCILASSDLSHYGEPYGHAPYGPLPTALDKVHQLDQKILKLALHLDGQGVLREARRNQNACGAGAIATAVEAFKAMGATGGQLLEYTTSMEILPQKGAKATVGYGALVLGN